METCKRACNHDGYAYDLNRNSALRHKYVGYPGGFHTNRMVPVPKLIVGMVKTVSFGYN